MSSHGSHIVNDRENILFETHCQAFLKKVISGRIEVKIKRKCSSFNQSKHSIDSELSMSITPHHPAFVQEKTRFRT